jgi:beta-N-acetylglucosaminidase
MEENNQTEVDFVLNFYNIDRERAIKRFIEHINKKNEDKCLDITEIQLLTDDEARKIIKEQYKIDHAIDMQKFDIASRNSYIKDLKERYGLSIRQIERVTGISRGVIQRI